MSFYVIADKDVPQLETIVFAGEAGDAVAVFTDPNRAQQYIDDAGWSEKQTVATLDPIAFMEWLISCHRNGVRTMMTDPKRTEHERGQRVDTLDIQSHLLHAGEHLHLAANPDF